MNIPAMFPLAAIENPSILNLVLTGFGFVVAILSILALLTLIGGRIFATRDARTRAATAAPTATASPSAAEVRQQREDNEGRITAVVTAAVHVALQDHRFRVRSIRRAPPGWAQEGRRQIFSSHRLR